MKVYSGLVILAYDDIYPCILLDQNYNFPSWNITNSSEDSLTLAKEGFYNITGTKDWPVYFNQVGAFEFFSQSYKSIYIIYNVYIPSICDIANNIYSWIKIKDVKFDSNVQSIIKYIHSRRN